MRTISALILTVALAACSGGESQQPATPSALTTQAMAAARDHLAAHEQEIVGELRDLLALPNVAANADDIRRNADALVASLDRRGVSARVLETPGAPASVFGELAAPGAQRTIVFYAHFDGQPIGDVQNWVTPPFTPTLRAGKFEEGAAIIPWAEARYPLADDARIYARSASDDKAPIVAMLAAIDALRAANIPLSANIKFFLEGEEEAGSPHLAQVLTQHRDALASDLWIFGDGPIDPSGRPRVVLGVRGVIGFDLTVFGPATSVHSGHYGNVAPNPAARLAHLIASMRAEDGRITIRGFEAAADRISSQMRQMSRDAYDDAEMLRVPQLAATESGQAYGESLVRPALNLTQLSYGGTGEARNAIDPEARAHFDVRLTPGLTLQEVRDLVSAHVRGQGYYLVDAPPTHEERLAHPRLARLSWGGEGYPAAQAPMDHPGVQRVIAVMRGATNGEVRVPPLLGGSLPISPIGEVLHRPFVIVPIVNADNNQHAPNENLRMHEFRQGVALYAALLADAGTW